jgi:hypothetical protein
MSLAPPNLSWNERVAAYVDELELTALEITSMLARTRVDTASMKAHEVQASLADLQDSLANLEVLIAARQDLLTADDAPGRGVSLSDVLSKTKVAEDLTLAKRCQAVGELIAHAHQQALSLFVCQFHLADFSGEIVRILVGASALSTYGRSATTPTSGSGGLFDKAA